MADLLEQTLNAGVDVLILRPEVEGLFQPYRDRLLLDASISDRDALLLCIYILDGSPEGATPTDCKKLFAYIGRKDDAFRKMVHWAKSNRLLDVKENCLLLLSPGLKRIMQLLGQTGKTPVYIFKSGEQFTAIKTFESFLLSQMNGEDIRLCDPYVGPATLHPFSVLAGKARSIRILTANIHESQKLYDYKKNFEKETGIVVEIRLNKKIHDRYILHNKRCWSLGTSIKDLGNKDTVLRESSDLFDSLHELFTTRWDEERLE